jgi:hypothetical protein
MADESRACLDKLSEAIELLRRAGLLDRALRIDATEGGISVELSEFARNPKAKPTELHTEPIEQGEPPASGLSPVGLIRRFLPGAALPNNA